MDLIIRRGLGKPVRFWQTWRDRGTDYALHKLMRRTLSNWPDWKRRLVYGDPRRYWTFRGGEDYFLEQEGQPARTMRAAWIADRLAAYRPLSILEVGCGYGKLMREIGQRLDIPIVGVDFSAPQLDRARDFLVETRGVELILARGEALPFADRSFDMVVTSAVVLHNPPALAERIRREVVRVARRYTAHNEETNHSYNRYGYDTSAWYRSRGIALLECGPIPMDPDPDASQFCVADLSARP